MAEEDDGYRDELDERVKKAAARAWRAAMDGTESLDESIAKARHRGREAARRGDDEMVYFWEGLEFTLDTGQQMHDVFACRAIERTNKLGEVWPDDYGRQLDAAGGFGP